MSGPQPWRKRDAEIAILNKSAVALAADSAVTVGGGVQSKVFNTVNKLFCLSRVHPVGAMISGAAEMGGVPWETIIKLYRATLDPAAFDSLDEYAKHFLAFLNGNKALFPENAQVQCVSSALRAAFHALIEDVKARYVIATQSKGCAPDPSEVAQMMVEACRSARNELDSAPFRAGQSEADAVAIRDRYAAVIARVRDESFMTLPMTKEAEGHIQAISGLIFSKDLVLRDLVSRCPLLDP